jgi:hypothetical protein
VSGRLLAEDGAHFTATIKRTEDGPQARYRLVFDAGEKASSGDCTPAALSAWNKTEQGAFGLGTVRKMQISRSRVGFVAHV